MIQKSLIITRSLVVLALMLLPMCALHAQTAQTAEKKPAVVLEVGQEAPDFALLTNTNDSLRLSSLRGKPVVVDFWGTWCGWCIKGMPKMKEYYEKYAGKFEIVSVDVGDKKQKWLDHLANADMPWKNVHQNISNMVSTKYGVRAFPSKFILDAEGKILMISSGEDKKFYQFLDDLFKE